MTIKQKAVTDDELIRPVRYGVIAVVMHVDEKLLVIRRSAHIIAPRTLCFPGGAG